MYVVRCTRNHIFDRESTYFQSKLKGFLLKWGFNMFNLPWIFQPKNHRCMTNEISDDQMHSTTKFRKKMSSKSGRKCVSGSGDHASTDSWSGIIPTNTGMCLEDDQIIGGLYGAIILLQNTAMECSNSTAGQTRSIVPVEFV